MLPYNPGSRAQWMLLGISAVLVAVLLSPFAKALFVAAVMSTALSRICDRIETKLGGRRTVAAGILTFAVLLLIVVPLLTIFVAAVKEAVEGVRFVRETLASQGASGLVELLPSSLRATAQGFLDDLTSEGDAIVRALGGQGVGAATALGKVLAATTRAFSQTVLALIALFFFLCDGHLLSAWALEVTPLPRQQLADLFAEFRKVSIAVLISSIATAAAQGLAALVGFVISKTPHALFFGFVTFVAAFIPVGGATLVGLLVAGFLFASGHPIAAAFLALWSVLLVGTIDNLIKPVLLKTGVRLHAAVIFFALLGGLAVFGMVGLIAGPLIVSLFVTAARRQATDRERNPDPSTVLTGTEG